MRLLIAGGGTGGHIYPALAVARSLRARQDAPELHWLGGHRGLEARIVGEAGIPVSRLALRSLRSVGLDLHALTDPVRLVISVPQALALLISLRPAAIFTTGGYVAIPAMLAARLLRIPVVLWEGNVVPGRSVRATARLATATAVSFLETCATLGGRCFLTGTPIRDPSVVDRAAALAQFGIAPGERLLLVFGGSQAVRRFNLAVAQALPELVERVNLLHVTGEVGHAEALDDRAHLPDALQRRYRPVPFLGADMTAALAAADLLVGRAGSSTLAEAAAFGLPMVVVPYPHAAGHQRANARPYVEAGGAHLVEDDLFDAAALLGLVGILEDPGRHARMSAAVRSLARPGAAEAVAELVLAVAEGRPLPDPGTVERISRRSTG